MFFQNSHLFPMLSCLLFRLFLVLFHHHLNQCSQLSHYHGSTVMKPNNNCSIGAQGIPLSSPFLLCYIFCKNTSGGFRPVSTVSKETPFALLHYSVIQEIFVVKIFRTFLRLRKLNTRRYIKILYIVFNCELNL